MARINIEDKIYKDNRFTELCIRLGSKWAALGALVDAWSLAQEYVTPETPDAPIPLEKWRERRACEHIITEGLAAIVDGPQGQVVIVEGAVRQFEWLVSAQLKGRMSGKRRAGLNPARKKTNPAEPLSSSLLSLSSSLFPQTLDNFKKEEELIQRTPDENLPFAPASGGGPKFNPVAFYCDCYKLRYRHKPVIRPKEAGILNKLAKDLGLEKFKRLMRGYIELNDAWLVKQAHPVNLISGKLNEISRLLETGQVVYREQMREADKEASVRQKHDSMKADYDAAMARVFGDEPKKIEGGE